MGSFQPVTLEWKGETKTIPANGVLRVIAATEEIVTLHELSQFAKRGSAPMARLSMAYGCILRCAGFLVTDEDVYIGLFQKGGAHALDVVRSLQELMLPPSLFSSGSAEGKDQSGEHSSSEGSTKQRSKGSGSRRASSGT